MKNKALAIFGIGVYILSAISSAEDLEGNYVAPAALIVVLAITMLAFTILAAVRLWKIQKIISVLFLISSLITLVYISAPVKIINFILFIWVVTLLWTIAKNEGLAKKNIKDFGTKLGLSTEETFSIMEDSRKGDHEAVVRKIALAQEQQKKNFKETMGIEAKDIIPEIGREISWLDVVNHVFRVFEFDRNGTTIDPNNQVKAKSSHGPYGYLLSESPILNNRVRLPIIHRDDFLLAASVFDDPKLSDLVVSKELLVTYSPKHLLPKGLSGSPHHVLHYAIVPSGTIDSYYSENNDANMTKPNPQKLLGPFAYEGEIRVQINSGLIIE